MKISIYILLCLILFSSPKLAHANEVIFSDDFSGNLNKWESTRGSLESWKIINGELTTTINQRFTVLELVPKSEFWTDEENISIDFDYTPLSGADKNFGFNYQDMNNWSEFHFSGSTLYLAQSVNGIYNNLLNKSVGLQNGNTYHINITLKNTTVSLSIDNLLTMTHEDPELKNKSGKISIKAGTGAVYPTSVKIDNIVVTSLQDDTLGVDLIKQSQVPWGLLEYDSASEWATASQGSTFSDWGCALTSAVMIMNYHGITKMPDGTPVTPLTLNNWLLANHGYVDGGNVSFAAIAGLTKKLSVQYGHPALQYSRNDLQPRETARAEIAADRPVVVVKPGHFMVADGIVTGSDDLYIKDPSFPYTKFSQHNAPQISTRLLTPSFTDVSFLTIAADPATQVKIFDETGHELDATPTIEQLESPINPGQFSPAVQIIEVPQPASGAYRIEVISDSTAAEMLDTTVTTIDRSGDSIRHTIPTDEQLAQLTFDKDAPSQIEYSEPEGYFKLRLLIEQLWKSQEISSKDLYEQLKEIVAVGEADSANQSVFETVKLLRRAISSHKVGKDLSTRGKTELMKGIQEVQVESVTKSER